MSIRVTVMLLPSVNNFNDFIIIVYLATERKKASLAANAARASDIYLGKKYIMLSNEDDSDDSLDYTDCSKDQIVKGVVTLQDDDDEDESEDKARNEDNDEVSDEEAEDRNEDEDEKRRRKVLARLQPLNADENAQVNAALQPPSNEQDKQVVLVELNGIRMTRRLMQSLNPRTWLNDEVINYYACMHQRRNRRLCRKQGSSCRPNHYFSVFFMSKLRERRKFRYNFVRRFYSRVLIT